MLVASEYLKWKYRDVKPEEKRTLTKAEQRRNWWHYHKWQVIIGIVLLLIGLDIGKSVLHIGEVTPDLQIAYVGTNRLPEDTAAAIEAAFAQYAEDANHDGKVTVRLNQYPSVQNNGDSSTVDTDNRYYAQASGITLMADLESCDSFLFLMEDYEAFQRDYQILEVTASPLAVQWCDLTGLSSVDLGTYQDTVAGMEVTGSNNELVQHLWVARRGFWNDRTCSYPDQCVRLWEQISRR